MSRKEAAAWKKNAKQPTTAATPDKTVGESLVEESLPGKWIGRDESDVENGSVLIARDMEGYFLCSSPVEAATGEDAPNDDPLEGRHRCRNFQPAYDARRI
ncbi:MAG: hypothetical protein CL799_00485 [Chromatiales bacterium]|nr:hypothetical protein [Chromatiales bacterium]